MNIVSVSTMQSLDEQTIKAGTPAEVLMEQAATAAYQQILNVLQRTLSPRHRARFAVLAGRGNNGGDALVIARLLQQNNIPVELYTPGTLNTFKGAASHHASLLPMELPLHIGKELPESAFREGTVIIDGLLGTGIAGPARAPFDSWISSINQSDLPVVSLDIPSGLDADTGECSTEAVFADLTITMALPKRGLLTPNGLKHTGTLRCADIGIPQKLVETATSCGEAVSADDIRPLLRRRPADAHKGTFGHALVIGGCQHYTGAPILAGSAALRIGSGLTTIALPKSIRAYTTAPMQALILRGMEDGNSGFLNKASSPELGELLAASQAVVIGPGIGRHPTTLAPLKHVMAGTQPTVVDADALRSLAANPYLVSGRHEATILTPHPGEMRLLLDGFGLSDLADAPRQEQALKLAAKSGAHIVLKGRGTILAGPDGRCAINLSGTHALASAGTGDILAGLIGGLLAQGYDAWQAMSLATFIHGYAAESAPYGARSLVADDLLNLIGPALSELSPFA